MVFFVRCGKVIDFKVNNQTLLAFSYKWIVQKLAFSYDPAPVKLAFSNYFTPLNLAFSYNSTPLNLAFFYNSAMIITSFVTPSSHYKAVCEYRTRPRIGY